MCLILFFTEFLSLTVSPSSGSAVLGAQTYVIACQITGNPTATNWYWTKTPSSGGQSENINRNTNNNKYTVQENAQNPQLTIKNIQQSDDANYVCNAQNTAGLRTSSAARLIVTGRMYYYNDLGFLLLKNTLEAFQSSFIDLRCNW